MKLKAADVWFSKVVREAADWTCVRCGKVYERGSQGMHNSHRYRRQHKSVRFAKENTDALCFPCHQWYGGDTPEAARWLLERIGQGALDLLEEKKNTIFPMKKHHWKEASAHYRNQHKILMAKRADGIEGPLDFESWQ